MPANVIPTFYTVVKKIGTNMHQFLSFSSSDIKSADDVHAHAARLGYEVHSIHPHDADARAEADKLAGSGAAMPAASANAEDALTAAPI
jgi:hypothetical protein